MILVGNNVAAVQPPSEYIPSLDPLQSELFNC